MLTEYQYRALRRYLDGPLPVSVDGLSDEEIFLVDHKYIEVTGYDITRHPVVTTMFASGHQITQQGRAAIRQYEEEQKRAIIKKRKHYLLNLLFVIIGAVVGSLVTYLLSGARPPVS